MVMRVFLFIMHKLKTFRKNPSVVSTELDDGAVLLNLDNKYYYNLNETGLRIWQIMEESPSPLGIAEKLTDVYEIDIERAKISVDRLIEELEKENLIIPNRGGD